MIKIFLAWRVLGRGSCGWSRNCAGTWNNLFWFYSL